MEPDICEAGGEGVVLPLFADEHTWSKSVRAIMYGAALGWHFLGVSIIADIFMSGIEAVTSKRRTQRLDNGQTVTLKVWNGTVANLTLMALGSSAPEILLNVIEIFSTKFYAGPLGPSTIIGSAAFNLLIIIAICMVVIPNDESRTIKSVPPFLVSAVFSVFAYLWLIVVLGISTPNLVEVWEGVLTFLFFPLLVVLAYLADVGAIQRLFSRREEDVVDTMEAALSDAASGMSAKDTRLLAFLQKEKENKVVSRAARRAEQVTAKTICAKDLSVGFLTAKYCFHEDEAELTLEIEKTGDIADDVRVGIAYQTRDGNMKSSVKHYTSHSGFCEIPAGTRYGQAIIPRDADAPKLASFVDQLDAPTSRPTVASVTSMTYARTQQFSDNPSAFFYIDIVLACKLPNTTYTVGKHHIEDSSSNKHGHKSGDGDHSYATNGPRLRPSQTADSDLGEEMTSASAMRINILPDVRSARVAMSDIKDSGRLRFEKAQIRFPGPPEETPCPIKVVRFNGTDGEIRCLYRCEADTAKAGYDFVPVSGELVFAPGVASQEIIVPILRKEAWENNDQFYVLLADAPGYPPSVEEQSSIINVEVTADKAKGISNQLMRLMDSKFNLDSFSEGNLSWKTQIRASFYPTVGDDYEYSTATAADWAFHIIALPWKVLFAFVPPATYFDGWLCFFIALACVGGITALIGDLAGLLGCVLGLRPGVTAITIVAVGTSLPDAFASKTAAVEDETADNAIGNVTGSNAVNVFLGIGLPWMLAAIYWHIEGPTAEWQAKHPAQFAEYPGGGFVVEAGDLVFSVIVFCIAAFSSLGVIWHRRLAFQAELGGPEGAKANAATFLVLLWCFYIGLASWKETGGKNASVGDQFIAIAVGIVCVPLVMLLVTTLYTGSKAIAKACCPGSAATDQYLQNQEVILAQLARANSFNKQGAGFLEVPTDFDNMSSREILSALKTHISGLNSLTRALENSIFKGGLKEKLDDPPDCESTVEEDPESPKVVSKPVEASTIPNDNLSGSSISRKGQKERGTRTRVSERGVPKKKALRKVLSSEKGLD